MHMAKNALDIIPQKPLGCGYFGTFDRLFWENVHLVWDEMIQTRDPLVEMPKKRHMTRVSGQKYSHVPIRCMDKSGVERQ